MQSSKKFAFDVGITFLASVVTLPLGFVIQTSKSLKSLTEFFDKTFLKSFRRYLGAGDLGLYRMTSTIYGIAMLVGAIGIPTAMVKNNKLKFIDQEYLYVIRNGKSDSHNS